MVASGVCVWMASRESWSIVVMRSCRGLCSVRCTGAAACRAARASSACVHCETRPKQKQAVQPDGLEADNPNVPSRQLSHNSPTTFSLQGHFPHSSQGQTPSSHSLVPAAWHWHGRHLGP
ncbi:unnamed protein product [Chrysodeixis includens]|uniref:Uncharacterized protein n=1 Tax=Chrysodeixis includens TaxID=689277 RepID=A0A9N8KQL4_CHRIL|nr:unnamed protein product [Chrysodeixis includens]